MRLGPVFIFMMILSSVGRADLICQAQESPFAIKVMVPNEGTPSGPTALVFKKGTQIANLGCQRAHFQNLPADVPTSGWICSKANAFNHEVRIYDADQFGSVVGEILREKKSIATLPCGKS